ncbi:hypothetical protein [Paenibacillus apiarius]|uniref:hypothetical protein n=1 Tax=Paenibacillus apiarius TaxID=46240 RepID=UPI003B96C61F
MDWFATIKRYFDMGIYKIEPEEPLYIGNFASLARFLQISSKKSQENNIKQSKRPVNRRRYFYALTLWGLFEL